MKDRRKKKAAAVWPGAQHCMSTKWRWRRRRRREGGRGAVGACERRGACRGEILTRTKINAPSDIKTHLGGIDDRERVIFILKY